MMTSFCGPFLLYPSYISTGIIARDLQTFSKKPTIKGLPNAGIRYCKRRYFRAAKFSRIKPYGAYSHVLIYAHKPVTSNFRAPKGLRKKREKMYCAEISTITVGGESFYEQVQISIIFHK